MATPQAAIEEFKKKVSGLYETEYGDFKRKIGQYLNNLELALAGKESALRAIHSSPGRNIKTNDHDLRIIKVIEELRQRIIYDPPMENMDEAREVAVEYASKLKSLV